MSTIREDINRYTSRKEQDNALAYIKKVLDGKPDNKFFLMNLPTGSGKSHLAMMISDYYSSKIDKLSNIDVVTPSKLLQDQYSDEYKSISNLKGINNYKCKEYECSCASGKEFNKLNNTKCDSCPYDSAKKAYQVGKLSMTNFHLYLIYALFSKKDNPNARQANLLIVDEAHELDDVMTDFISMKVTENSIKKMKLTNDRYLIEELKKVNSIEAYVEYIKILREEALQTAEKLEVSMFDNRDIVNDKRSLTLNSITGVGEHADIKTMKVINELKQTCTKIDIFSTEYKKNPDNWVLEFNYNEVTKQKDLSLEPIWAGEYLQKYVWSKYDMVILMSGTILNKDLFCQLNGIDAKEAVYYSIPSPFPQKHRPIYYTPIGKMSYAKKEETFRNYVPFIEKLLKKYVDKKGIIHTNSFELASWIQRDITNSRLVYHDSSNKEEVLKEHFKCKGNSVIVSPSMTTGVSFDHDRARFQIIAKVPYPSLASQKNKKRQKLNPEWYTYVTVAKLIQSMGRVVRSKTDYGDTIIIDESFGDIMKYSSHYLPLWLQESIIIPPMKRS